MAAMAALTDAVAELAASFAGTLLQPADSGYEDARRVHNGLVDKRPALIARCRGVADVVAAIHLARRQNLEIAVRGGGHNVAGRATLDDGIVLDLSLMKGVHVDPYRRTARVEGGVTWAEFNRETQLHGLATTGGVVSSTGVAGLTLGGGLGWLMGKYGLAVDNLLSADLVTAEGQVLTASEAHDADLFWAIRGGGGNFGVVTSFEFQLHAVGPTVTGGLVAYPLSAAREMFAFYRELTRSLPDDLVVFAGLIHAPDGSGDKLAAMVAGHCGPLDAGEAAVRPIKQFGAPLVDTIGPISYCGLNTMLDAASPRGALNYWKSSFLNELGDAAVDAMIAAFECCPAPLGQILIEHVHGVASEVVTGDTAFVHRAPGYNLALLSQWVDPRDNDPCRAWARDAFEAMRPFMAAGRYVNYLDEDEGEPASAYGSAYPRLQRLKSRYDPANVFHMNQNIRPRP